MGVIQQLALVLSQIHDSGDHPVAFESRKMNSAEVNYPTHERELLAVIHALRTWRHYLEGKEVQGGDRPLFFEVPQDATHLVKASGKMAGLFGRIRL